jgi:hypothetical protein
MGSFLRKKKDGHRVPAVERLNAGGDERRKGADHVDFTMGKIDQLDDPIYHGVAQRNHSIDAPAGQPGQEKFHEIVEIPEPASCRLSFDLIHGEADTDGITFFIETDFTDRGFDVMVLQGLANCVVVGRPCFCDRIEQAGEAEYAP